MPIVNQYHGCQIASSDDQQRHDVVCDGRSLGSFPTLAEAIQAARNSRAALASDEPDDAVPPDDLEFPTNNDPE